MLELMLLLALVGFVVYMVVTYIPMPPPFKTAIIVIVALCLIVYVMRLFGLDLPMPRAR